MPEQHEFVQKQGSYEKVKLNRTSTPASVKLNGVELPRMASAVEFEVSEHGWYFTPTFVVYAKFKGLGGRCELVLWA